MVSKLLKLCIGLMFLATVIHGNFNGLEKKLNNMARKGENIYNLFMPYENGIIRRSDYSLVYKGERIADHHHVAFKFVKKGNSNKAKHEFVMYSYLNATNNIEVQRYGISAIHYYQEWGPFVLTVFSSFDGGDLHDLLLKGYFNLNNASLAINSLILFRDFVLQSKYMHSHGVRHNDIKPTHIAVRLGRSFLFDFTLASTMMQDNGFGTSTFLARAVHCRSFRKPKADWESFLYTMAFINQIELGWLFRNPAPGKSVEFTQMMIGELKCMTGANIEKIEKAPFGSKELRKVFIEFARETLNNTHKLPNYDRLYEVITGQIEQLITPHQNALFTWIQDNEKEAAIRDLEQASFDIAGISDPLDDFHLFEYPSYNVDFFPKPENCPEPIFESPKRCIIC